MLALLSLLCSCKEDAKTAVPLLIEQLESSNRSERNAAALKLASYGAQAKRAVPALATRLSDENAGVRSSAAYALRSIGTSEATKALDHYEK